MTGNAWQWVADWYDFNFFAQQAKEYGDKAILNPQGPTQSFDPADIGVPPNALKRLFVADHSCVTRIIASRIDQVQDGDQILTAQCLIWGFG
jgi:formylglycine-generating enzyme required for sulfatase activity